MNALGGAIHWTRIQGEARAELVEQWARDSTEHPDKTRFVIALDAGGNQATGKGRAQQQVIDAQSFQKRTVHRCNPSHSEGCC